MLPMFEGFLNTPRQHGQTVRDVYKRQILDSYYNHDLDTLATIYSYQELPDSEYQQEYQNYQQLLIIDRNQTMQAKIIEYLNQNKVVFIGVGVGHVVGDLGLITSLSAAGYKVEKLG